MFSVSVLMSLALLGVVKSQGFVPGVADQCYDPVSPGPCRAFIPSFYFNPLTETCDCFVFGGCKSNGNKFSSLNECMNTCSVNPQLQTISPTCIRIFGADNSNFNVTPRPITPKPVAFSIASTLPIVTVDSALPTKAIPTTAVPTTPAPTYVPTTSAPVRSVAPVANVFPTGATNSNLEASGTTNQHGNQITRNNEALEHTAVVGSIFSQRGVTGHTSITIGQPVFIGQRS
ncbi:unnamed protein product [Meganyctiphanes norvegica]|uniref:BPTI/Kunitz inhibitor domain-containing protein n=1 Tax=Meganyctiphanes norvegica TaxID=48144 RepID=A0AAV2QYY6_MEGNR